MNEIPFGEYCYAVVELAEGEGMPEMTEEFGRSQREAGYTRWAKRVLCPHWKETDHGTVRCEFLGVEAVIESRYTENLEKAIRHFGSAELFERVHEVGVSGTFLMDEIKICDQNLESDEPDSELEEEH